MVSSDYTETYGSNVISLDGFLTEPGESYKDYVVGMVIKEFHTDDKGNFTPDDYSFLVDIDDLNGHSLICTKFDTGAKKYLYDILSGLTVAVTPETQYKDNRVEIPDMADVTISFDDSSLATGGRFSVNVLRKRPALYPIEEYEVIEGFGLF